MYILTKEELTRLRVRPQGQTHTDVDADGLTLVPKVAAPAGKQSVF